MLFWFDYFSMRIPEPVGKIVTKTEILCFDQKNYQELVFSNWSWYVAFLGNGKIIEQGAKFIEIHY